MSLHYRRRFPRTRRVAATNALNGMPVVIVRTTLWGRLLRAWDSWRLPPQRPGDHARLP